MIIPRADVEIVWEVDYATLREPSANDLEYGCGTRQYASALVIAATWEEARCILERENHALTRVASAATNESEFERLAHEAETEYFIDDPNEGLVAAPDLGMFAACVGLCAAGCATCASCRGHPGEYAWSDHPVIQFMADPIRARIIQEIAQATGCGLASVEGRLVLWAQSIEETLSFAQLLLERVAEFDATPPPDILREARGLATGPPSPPPGQDPLF